MVVSRLEMRATIARLLKMLLKVPETEKPLEPEILPPMVTKPEVRPGA
jgi:acetyl-CoA carboxylase carboxyl transferase subunit beta